VTDIRTYIFGCILLRIRNVPDKIMEKIKPTLYVQQGLGNTQRKARELISGPCLGAKARFLSPNRTQSRAVTGLTGHNTLKRHLHLMGLSDSPLCRRCRAEEACEALASFRHVYLGSSFLEPEDNKSISMGAIWNFSKVTELPLVDMWHKGPIN
jgi:hypothetical protein